VAGLISAVVFPALAEGLLGGETAGGSAGRAAAALERL
jgi:hypothetical protein